jgi:hypothetical protein
MTDFFRKFDPNDADVPPDNSPIDDEERCIQIGSASLACNLYIVKVLCSCAHFGFFLGTGVQRSTDTFTRGYCRENAYINSLLPRCLSFHRDRPHNSLFFTSSRQR